jgi:hypothetical protein
MVLEGEKPSLAVLIAALFGMKPLAYQDSGMVKKVLVVFNLPDFLSHI